MEMRASLFTIGSHRYWLGWWRNIGRIDRWFGIFVNNFPIEGLFHGIGKRGRFFTPGNQKGKEEAGNGEVTQRNFHETKWIVCCRIIKRIRFMKTGKWFL